MAKELAYAPLQTVPFNRNVLLYDTSIRGGNCILHREGSGVATLRGSTNQRRALYLAIFTGNIALTEGETVGPISLAISVDGEPLAASTMTVTPAAVGDFFNVATVAIIEAPCGCCVTVSVRNVSEDEASVDVIGGKLTLHRIA